MQDSQSAVGDGWQLHCQESRLRVQQLHRMMSRLPTQETWRRTVPGGRDHEGPIFQNQFPAFLFQEAMAGHWDSLQGSVYRVYTDQVSGMSLRFRLQFYPSMSYQGLDSKSGHTPFSRCTDKMILQKVVILYWMDGCPHCEANEKAWKEFCKTSKKDKVATRKVESANVPTDKNVGSFPTMVLEIDGKEVKRTTGAKQSGKEIKEALGVRGGSRRHTLRHRHARRGKTLRR